MSQTRAERPLPVASPPTGNGVSAGPGPALAAAPPSPPSGAPAPPPPPSSIPNYDQLVPRREPVRVAGQQYLAWYWDEATPRLIQAQVRLAFRIVPHEPDVVTIDEDTGTESTARGEITEVGVEMLRTRIVFALVEGIGMDAAEQLSADQVDHLLTYLGYLKGDAPKAAAPTTTA